jgi:hypothetical protein
MGFVQATFLFGLGALAIPVVVHLIFRWQTRQVDLGTLRFLTEVIRHNARRKRLLRWLLLAARLACVAAAVVLFARPYLLALEPEVTGRSVVVLVDRSASMGLRSGGRPRWELAVEQARDLVLSGGENAHWEAAAFDQSVYPAGARNGSDDDDRDAALDALRPADDPAGATDYGAAMAWARDVCLRAPPGPIDVHVLTDLQRSGLGWTPTEAFPAAARLHVHDLGQPLVNNVAVAALAHETLARPGRSLAVRATVVNHGPFPLHDLPVVLALTSEGRARRVTQGVSLDPGATADVDLELPALESGLWQGFVQIEADDELAFDNQRHLAVLATPQRRVLLLDGAPGATAELDETFFLAAALRLAPLGQTWEETPFAPESIDLAAAGVPTLDERDLVVLANAGPLPAVEAQRLGDFVRAGGGLLVFVGENVTPAAAETLSAAGLVPGRIGDIVRAIDLPLRWQSWDASHPLLAPFADPQTGDLRRLAFDARTTIEPSADARVLADFNDGAPALVKHRLGQGRVLWFASSCGRSWSDWPRSRLFVPLIHQMLGDLAGLTGGGPIRQLVLEGAETSREPGVYPDGQRWLVVNPSPRESETERVEIGEFADRFGLTLAGEENAQEASSEPVAAAGLALRDDELWQWVAVALVALLCGEAFLANRTTV